MPKRALPLFEDVRHLTGKAVTPHTLRWRNVKSLRAMGCVLHWPNMSVARADRTERLVVFQRPDFSWATMIVSARRVELVSPLEGFRHQEGAMRFAQRFFVAAIETFKTRRLRGGNNA